MRLHLILLLKDRHSKQLSLGDATSDGVCIACCAAYAPLLFSLVNLVIVMVVNAKLVHIVRYASRGGRVRRLDNGARSQSAFAASSVGTPP